MLWAILSDIHANIEALDAVTKHLEEQKVDKILCLGDVIGYGPEPREALRRAFDYEVTLRGNHEDAAQFFAEDFNERARVALDWTRDQINAGEDEENQRFWEFIGSMPESHRVGNALLVHGSPRNPVREYMLPKDAHDREKMEEIFALVPDTYCFVGHSHVPGVYTEQGQFLAPHRLEQGFRPRGKAVVNVGSVGQPRDGDPRASYVTWDGENIWFHRVSYDFSETQRKIIETGVLPRYLAMRLQDGR